MGCDGVRWTNKNRYCYSHTGSDDLLYPSWLPGNGTGIGGDIQPVSYRDTEECYCMDMLLQTIGCQEGKITVQINLQYLIT